MSTEVCIILCVAIICSTILVLRIIEHYPEWCSFFEYKDKAREYDKLNKQNNEDVKELIKNIDGLQQFINKDTHNAYQLLQVILEIKLWFKEKDPIKIVEGIKVVLNNNRL